MSIVYCFNIVMLITIFILILLQLSIAFIIVMCYCNTNKKNLASKRTSTAAAVVPIRGDQGTVARTGAMKGKGERYEVNKTIINAHV